MRAHALISKRVLGVIMRPINVSLCSTTWELAKEKANFSGWVRRKLMEEKEKASPSDHKAQILFGAYCKICDITYQNTTAFIMEFHHCDICNERCEYLGELE